MQKKIMTISLILAILALTVTLTLTGIKSVVELWQASLAGGHWLLPFIITPLVAGICATVCYLFYNLLTDEAAQVEKETDYFFASENRKHHHS